MRKISYVRRVKINTGYLCNARCKFCYYLDWKKGNMPIEKIKKQLRGSRKGGMEHVDFSGGEPTIHKNFLEIIRYAKSLNFKTICTLTNGIKLADYDFFKKCVDAGLNEVLYSVHGSNEKNHDDITQVKGSFKKMLKSIENGEKLGVKLRFNVTVSSLNYKNLREHANLFSKLKPYQVNFIIFNEWCYGKRVAKEMEFGYSKLTPYLKGAIDILRKARIPSINVRYLPFCFLPEGYEKYFTNHLQIPHDPYEWNPRLRFKFEEQSRLRYYVGLLYNVIRYRSFDHETNVVKASREEYTKPKVCKRCKFYLICDGLHNTYLDFFGDKRLNPVEGKYIKNPLEFRKANQ